MHDFAPSNRLALWFHANLGHTSFNSPGFVAVILICTESQRFNELKSRWSDYFTAPYHSVLLIGSSIVCTLGFCYPKEAEL
jgi:hypothetical protein